uniref:Protein vip1 n=1 Tax=Anthurium amnicola TaxID=1678845 RepID=A0A1D1YI95_9ARAE
MNQSNHMVEVTNLSPNATERDVYNFFSFSGEVEHVEIIRSGEYASTAYVTFKEGRALETACLLSGSMILDQPVCIDRWGHHEDPYNLWTGASWQVEDGIVHTGSQVNNFSMTPGEAVTMTQEVVKTMLSKGYVLSKDALSKAKAFDESHQVSATAAAKIAELSKRIGLTDKINTSVDTLRYVDEQYHVSQTTKTVASATGRTATAVTNSIVNSSYFSAGALWVSGVLTKAADAVADLGARGSRN